MICAGAGIASIIRKIAREYDAVLVPYDKPIGDPVASGRSGDEKDRVRDGIHPTCPAHKRMAGLWIAKARKLL